MRTSIVRFINDESGATAIEYGLIAAGIAVAVIAGMATLGPAITGILQGVANSLS
jgi:pilus assembly protein Flp/PilA